jgi:hypothetical protein
MDGASWEHARGPVRRVRRYFGAYPLLARRADSVRRRLSEWSGFTLIPPLPVGEATAPCALALRRFFRG